jgi:hypothetical protein
MATGHKSFSVVAELNSSVPGKIAAPVSPREGYPELPILSDYYYFSSHIMETLPAKSSIYPSIRMDVIGVVRHRFSKDLIKSFTYTE